MMRWRNCPSFSAQSWGVSRHEHPTISGRDAMRDLRQRLWRVQLVEVASAGAGGRLGRRTAGRGRWLDRAGMSAVRAGGAVPALLRAVSCEREDIGRPRRSPGRAYRYRGGAEAVRRGYQPAIATSQMPRGRALPGKVVRRWRSGSVCQQTTTGRRWTGAQWRYTGRGWRGEIALGKAAGGGGRGLAEPHRLKCAASPRAALARLHCTTRGAHGPGDRRGECVSAALSGLGGRRRAEPNHKPELGDERRLALYHQPRQTRQIAQWWASLPAVSGLADRWGLESHARRAKGHAPVRQHRSAGRTSATNRTAIV